MPNTREKLIEFLQCTPDIGMSMKCSEMLADHLIANGVTVQKWISVKERLPEVAWRVLVTDGTNVNFGYTLCFEIKGVSPWCTLSPVMPDKVTHWMPLPEPPKGE